MTEPRVDGSWETLSCSLLLSPPVIWITPLAESCEGELVLSGITAVRPELESTKKIPPLVPVEVRLEALLPNETNKPPALIDAPRSEAPLAGVPSAEAETNS